MVVRISPVSRQLRESEPVLLTMPPDKSILHRLLLLGSLTKSHFRIPIASPHVISHDVVATMLALESLGVPVDVSTQNIELHGVGRRGYRAPSHAINCANSGTTARLLMGLLAGQSFSSTITGDASLALRPMKRVADVLSLMGAHIATAKEGTLPAKIEGQMLHGAEITLPVASAQMKSAVLLAGLFVEGPTSVREPSQSRDHTERMMESFGFGIERGNELKIWPDVIPDLAEEVMYDVPGDLSSAAFVIVATILLRKRLAVTGVSLNPSRTRFLDIVSLMGVEIGADNIVEQWDEPRGNMTIYGDRLTGSLEPFHIGSDDVPLMIDELPALMVLGLFANGESTVRGASELRLKESDRLQLVAKQFQTYGVKLEELEDGIVIQGVPDRPFSHAPILHGGDHRLAMAFSIAALFGERPIEIETAETVAVSYPEFFEHLQRLCGNEYVEVRAT